MIMWLAPPCNLDIVVKNDIPMANIFITFGSQVQQHF
jgi:hypothetical protein